MVYIGNRCNISKVLSKLQVRFLGRDRVCPMPPLISSGIIIVQCCVFPVGKEKINQTQGPKQGLGGLISLRGWM